MSNFNAYAYAGDFGLRAYEYAREALDNGELDSTNIEEWAYETAQGLDAVIYYYQALSLFTAGYFDEVDDEYANQSWRPTDNAQLMILNLCCALSYSWHYERLYAEATNVIDGREYSTHMNITDAACN